MLGRQLRSFILPQNQESFDVQVAGLKSGLYNLVLIEDGQLLYKRFIKK
jgi:hypothetical protein